MQSLARPDQGRFIRGSVFARALFLALAFLSPPAVNSSLADSGGLPSTLPEAHLLLLEVSWDYGDVAPLDWRQELTATTPKDVTEYFRLRWRHSGPGFDHATLLVTSDSGTPLGEVALPLTSPAGDGFRYTTVTMGDLPGDPTLILQAQVKDASDVPLGPPSNEVQISAGSPADPFLYTPLFILGVQMGNQVPGIAGSVWCGESDEVRTWTAGVRRFDGGAGDIASDDRWQVGSCTKAFTATLIGRLIQDGTPLPTGGTLDWDTPLSAIFPEWSATMHPRFKNTTIRHLACHRSGLRMSAQEYNDLAPIGPGSLHEDPTAGRRIMTKRLLERDHTEDDGTGTLVSTIPGTKWFYGSGNYLILGAVIEQLTGQTYEIAMRNMIFNPLFITSAGWGVPVDFSPYQPHGHRRLELFPHNIVRDNFSGQYVWDPAGGLYLSQQDWLKFCRLHINGSEGVLRLDPSTLAELHTPYPREFPAQPPNEDDPSYGWGWGIGYDGAGGLVLGHDGTYGIFYSRASVHIGYRFAVVSAVNIGPGRGFGDVAIDQLHNHLIEKAIEKTTGGAATSGHVDSPSGGSTGIVDIQGQSLGGAFEHQDLTPIRPTDFGFQLGEGFLPASLADLDVFARSIAATARLPRAVGFTPSDDGRFLLRSTSESGFIYDIYRSTDLGHADWSPSEQFVGRGSETEILLQPADGARQEYFQIRDRME